MLLRELLLVILATSARAKYFHNRMDTMLSAENLLIQEWETYKLQHGKVYEDEVENTMRMDVFMNNRLFIAEHNQLYEQGKISYSVEMNEFGDMTDEEFEQNYFGEIETEEDVNRNEEDTFVYNPQTMSNISASIDWREEGAVTKIKDQKKCGSCYSFSAAAALEGQHYMKTGYLIDLSEQNLVDCSVAYGNNGCQGGNTRQTFQFIKVNGGINSFRSYPYEAKLGKCRFIPRAAVATDKGFKWVDKSEQSLKAALATIGPISVSIDAKGKGFRFYKTGVYYASNCSKTKLKHAVVAVGYGLALNGDAYWIVKNSWGLNWGERGYVRMARNRNNLCGIANRASYPIV